MAFSWYHNRCRSCSVDVALPNSATRIVAIPRDVADCAVDRARTAGCKLGRQVRNRIVRLATVAVSLNSRNFSSFFPIAVGTLRGLASAPAAAVELMDSYAASWKQTLFKLRFPAAVPFMVPAFKLGASGAVVGVVVAEISTGLKGGIGRLIIEYAREATGDPAKVFTAVFGAAALGITMSGLVALSDVLLMRNRPKETTT